jgi:tubulin-specific chaperone E
MMEGFTLGSRVRDVADGTRATVKYIGPVAAAKNKTELWLGVEWDKTGRGKHDGSCVDETGLLHRYFQCAMGDGSFVKANKVTSGRKLTDALKEKYVGHDAPATVGPDSIVPDAFVVTSKGHQKSIEFVGELKLRKWQQIGEAQQVGIRDDTVSSIGDGIAEIAAFVTEIDLQDNLLWEWKEIASLSKQLPQLSTILLHGNKMQQLSPSVMLNIPSDSMRGLKVLALNSCNIKSWTSLQLLEPFLPSIEELYLALNDFSDLPKPEELSELMEHTSETAPATAHSTVSGFPNLRLLDFTSCKIDSWHQLLHFSKLPRLEELILDGNPISSILSCPCPPSSSANTDIAAAVEEAASSFPSLQRMSLSCSKLSAWSDIDSLASYQSCRFLRLSQVPLFAGKGASEVRPLVIGRMPSLVFFNGSGISPRERTDAEKSYLRSIMFAIDDATAAGKDNSFMFSSLYRDASHCCPVVVTACEVSKLVYAIHSVQLISICKDI